MNHPTFLPILAFALLGGLPATANIPDGYVLKWSDEFDYTGAPDPAKWTHETGAGGWGNNEDQTYTDSLDNSRVEDGNLIIEVRQILDGRSPRYTSARLITREKAQWKYGRFEIRAKLPSETGTWPAIWLLYADKKHGNGGWPDNGEIDIVEHVGYEEDPLFKNLVGNPSLPNVHGTVHTSKRNGLENTGIGDKIFIPTASTEFHTYAINWTDGRIEWEVDGQSYFVLERDPLLPARDPPEDPWEWWPFNQRFFLILNIAVGGTWGGHFNSNFYPDDSPYGNNGIDDDGVWPQRMVVDYVRVYGPDEPPEATAVPGRVLADDLDDGPGVILQDAGNIDVDHNLSNIDPDDYAAFAVEAPAAGLYTISAATAAQLGGRKLNLVVPETASAIRDISLPGTGDWQAWQTTELGTVQLQQGVNTIRLSTDSGGFNVAYLEVETASGQSWKGWPVDPSGNVETNSWLGRINVSTAPWIYSYGQDRFIFMTAAGEETFRTADQWIFFPKPISN